jgi:hypothetical protein
MSDSCFIDAGGFWDATKEFLDKDTAKNIFDRLKNKADQKQAGDKLNQADALRQALIEETDELERQAKLEQYRSMLNYFVSTSIDGYIGRFSNPLEGLEGTLVGQYAKIEESLSYATELAQRTEMARAQNSFLYDLMDAGVYKTFIDRSQSNDMAKEAFKLGSSGNANAQKAAEIYKTHLEYQRKKQNSLGANIGSLEEYMGAQSHDPEKLLQFADSFRQRMAMRARALKRNGNDFAKTTAELQEAAYLRWKNYVLPRLDKSRTFANVDPGDEESFLRGSWEGLVTNRHLSKEEFGDPVDYDNQPKLFKNYGDKLGASRKLHFKDGTAWNEYSQQYGVGKVQETMVNSLRRGASNIALLSKWGPNPQRMFEIKLNKSLDDASRLNFIDKQKLAKTGARLQAYFDMLDGTAYIPVSFTGAKTGQALRSWQTLSKLGGVVLSSIPDVALRAEMMRGLGKNPLGAYFEAFSDILRGKSDKERKRIADATGVWAESSFGHMSAYMADSTNPYGMVTKTQMMYNKLTMLEWWDETNRLAAGSFLGRWLALAKNKPFEKLSQGNQNTLKMYGLGKKEWDLMRDNENTYRAHKGKQFITPDAAYGYSDESIARYLDKDPTDVGNFESQQVKDLMHNRLMGFFIDKTDDASLRPGIKAHFTFNRGTRKGTWAGEILRFMGQFKYYSIEYGRRILGRKMFGMRIDKGRGLQVGSPDIAGLVNVIIGSTILGYVSMQSKNVMKNRTMRSPEDPGTWVAAMLQGGGLGLYGDFFFGQHDRFGNSLIESLAGPVPVSLEQGATILFKMKNLEDPTNQIVQFAKNNTPFLNLFYLRYGLDFLLLNGLQEQLSPGSLQRFNDNLMQQNDQQFMFNPLAISLIK